MLNLTITNYTQPVAESSLLIANPAEMMITSLVYSSQELQIQANRIEKAIQECQALESQIPGLIESINRLRIAQMESENSKSMLEATHSFQMKSLLEQEKTLTEELSAVRARIAQLTSQNQNLQAKINGLQQQIDYYKSPAGQQAAFNELIQKLRTSGF